jgi:hypothetical protein
MFPPEGRRLLMGLGSFFIEVSSGKTTFCVVSF